MKKMNFRRAVIMAAVVLQVAAIAPVATAEEEMTAAQKAGAEANNPLANMVAFNIQNYYFPELSELDGQNANTSWLRYAQPMGRWLFRGSLPISRVPTGIGTTTSGLGDFNAFLAYNFDTGSPGTAFGIGPLISLPTATEDETGAGKYQAGFASVYFNGSSPQFQYGGLLTWQTDFAGDDDRADTSLMTLQPFYFWQLGKGLYLRGAPIMVFNLETNSYHVPVGLGVGKIVKSLSGTTVYNFFIEPQFTILDRGPGQPEFQLYMALNMQFK